MLFLAHRIPYPPNKGDKVRSYHLLMHLASRHRVFLGAFVDDVQDLQHVSLLRKVCESLHISRLRPFVARSRSLTGFIRREPLSLPYYRDTAMRQWVTKVIGDGRCDAVVVFSSAMAQYVCSVRDVPVLVDFVDVDSSKWAEYALTHRWPLSWIYKREGVQLLAHDRAVARASARSFFSTEKEASVFRCLAPESAFKVVAMTNGVDAKYFSPDGRRQSPFPSGLTKAIVFTGAMDYWPNVDAARWFALEILPLIIESYSDVRFYIVGRNPGGAVLALRSESVVVTGTVTDVRPYLQYAAVVVAPLRVARGVQNKVLEAMSMARPVVASSECVSALHKSSSSAIFSADSAIRFAGEVVRILGKREWSDGVGKLARKNILDFYAWDSCLSVMDPFIFPSSGSNVHAQASLA